MNDGAQIAQATSTRKGWLNGRRLSSVGCQCYMGPRVPVRALFNYLETGQSIDEFPADFPSVSGSQALG